MKRSLLLLILAASSFASTASDNGGVFQPTGIWTSSYDGTNVVSFLAPYNDLDSISRNLNNEPFFFAGVLTPNQTRDESLDNVYIPGWQHCCIQPGPWPQPTPTPDHVTPESSTAVLLALAIVGAWMWSRVARWGLVR